MLRRAPDNTKAIDAFMAAKAEIDTMLARLAAFSAEHFCRSPDAVDWGDVGDLVHYREKLRQITGMAFKEGEYA